jgi:hypothetical protein
MMKSLFELMAHASPCKRLPLKCTTAADTNARRTTKTNAATILRSYHRRVGLGQRETSRYLSGHYFGCYGSSRDFSSCSSLSLSLQEGCSSFHVTEPFSSDSDSNTASSNSSIDANTSNNGNRQNTNKSSQEQKVFPWRENATEPLSRLLEKNDLSGLPNSNRSRFIKKLTVGIEMKVPLWQLFLTGSWEQDLAQNCSWAFRNALAGLLSRTFQVPIFSIENNDKFVKFDYNLDKHSTSGGSGDHEHLIEQEKTEHADQQENVSHCNDLQSNEHDDDDDNGEYVQAMVEENLLKLYTRQPISHTDVAIHNSNHRRGVTKAHFYLEPVSSRLENIFLIPSLTRDDVKRNETLRGAYTAIEKAFHEKGDIKVITDMANSLMRRVSHGGSKRSIIMDVSINCLETFYIKAGEELIQGNDKRVLEEVTHLVRFEMQTNKGENDARERELGSWYIIDIDDQLNGNVWH